MSIEALAWSYSLKGLSPTEKAILNCLCWHHRKSDSMCCPTHQMIADETGYGRRSVIRAITSLTEKGLLTYIRKQYRSCYGFPPFVPVDNSTTDVPESHISDRSDVPLCPPDVPESHISDVPESHHSIGLYKNKEKRNVELKLDHPVDNSTTKNGSQVLEVFEFWKAESGHQRAKLDDKRKRLIRARLKDGYSVAELGKAILGNLADDFHRGHNDRSTKYDDIGLVCRDATHVDRFLAIAEKKGLEVEA